MKNIIEVKNLTKKYKELKAVDDLSFEVHEGEILGLLGPNREFDSCLQFFTNQIAQNVDYINTFEFFYCQIRENICTNMG